MYNIIVACIAAFALSHVLATSPPSPPKPPKYCIDPLKEWSNCGSACPASCSTYNNTCLACTLQCVQGCFCKPGYVLNDNGDCINPDDCPRDCGVNENWDWCPPTCPPHQNCSVIWSKFDCTGKDLDCCAPGCRCNDGHFRNDDGICVTVNECIHKCGNNAYYEDCSDADSRACVQGCVCQKGYVREGGVCVKEYSQECPVNEHWTNCTNPCPEGAMCYVPCIAGCICDYGFERIDNICVKTDECGVNAHYVHCPSSYDYEGDDCIPGCQCDYGYVWNEYEGVCKKDYTYPCGPNSHYDPCPPTNCPPGMMCPAVCRPACVCDKGYEQNNEGDCVKSNDCGLNEYWNPCPPCPPGRACAAVCIGRCVCIEGYEYNKYGDCVKKSGNNNCNELEVYNDCGTACPPTCDNPKPELYTYNCVQGCFCKPGLYRNQDRDCVPFDQCPHNCGRNETYAMCAFGCPTNYCPESNGPTPQCMPPKDCKPGCVCKGGYKRDRSNNNECVLIEDCPKPLICGENEHYDKCGTACPLTCDQPEPRPCTKQCVRGCFCNDGLVRNSEGKCIPKEECNNHVCKPTEVYKDCGTACPRTCKNPNPQICTEQCVSGCFCKDGLFRTENGDCVPFPECPNNCDENETYAFCAVKCPTDYCPRSNNEPPQCDPPYPCPPGCICKKGFIRNNEKDNKCIPKEDCPPPVTCGKDEYYHECGTSCPPTCDNPNPQFCDKKCNRGCFCVGDLVRNSKGKCVPVDQCPDTKKCTKPNEVWDKCNALCQTTCDNYGNSNRACPAICKPGCVCAKGYARDNNGECILTRDCQPTEKETCYKKHEIWDECSAMCQPSCDYVDDPHSQNCLAICKSGCICEKGYFRNRNGDCVKPKDCPRKKCPKNEVYKKCGTACPRTCKNKDIKINCIEKCVEGCFCEEKLVRDDDNVCIPPRKCKNISTKLRAPKNVAEPVPPKTEES